MKKLLNVLVFILFLTACKKEKEAETLQIASYQEYQNDMQIVSVLNGAEDCEQLIAIFETLKTIDGKEKLYRLGRSLCDFEYPEICTKGSHQLTDKLGNIFNNDQSVREEFSAFIQDKDLDFSPGTNFSEELKQQKFYWDSIAKKTDSLNLLEFTSIIDSTGEWIGVEYLKRNPNSSNLGILIGHFPEKEYMKYTIMAYESATKGKEYWNSVEKMIGFSKKYHIEDMEYYTKRKKTIPFRFLEYELTGIINEKSDLTQLEFTNIAKVQVSSNDSSKLYFELSSSIDDIETRRKLLAQAKNLLIKLGRDENSIRIKEEKESHKEYKLYYEIVR
ncbi:hypothetical protein IMCC3317_13680 [Kordia antarctica]|uniref:Lipoprotein n=1 Tax=Kordia antarctica TaxID=1218801 RepID=A0A7L4ZHD5_9FLAO|nr:hypothetical protein [Kordia antarctica]QHI36015.1 hypothetical protein IMCC3317_13680 [Kordia antarctica]